MRTRDVADAAGGEACDVAEAAGGEACDVADAAGDAACDAADAAGDAVCDVADAETRDETLRGAAAREMREAASAEAKDTSANAGIGAPRALAADDGFFFGLGAFETIAVEHGMPVFLDAHLARLKEALDFLGIERDEETLRTAVEGALANDERAAAENAPTENARKEGERAAAANAVAENAPTDGATLSHVAPFGRRVLKLTVTAENMIVTMRDNGYCSADYDRGFACAISAVQRNESSPLTFRKTLNYGDCILEKRAAKARGIDEPLFLNTRGQLCEGATSNVFLVQHGAIVTPPVESGLLPGIMRAYVRRAVVVEERPLTLEDALAADEMFLTNSLMDIMSVRSLDGHDFSSMATARRLHEGYWREFDIR